MKLIPTAIAVAAAVILLLLWKHESDARRDGRIEQLTIQIHADSIALDSLVTASTKAATKTAAKIDTFTKLDTAWSRHRDTVTKTVDHIVHDTVADSVKIQQLAVLVEVTKAKADSTVKVAEGVVITVRTELLTSFAAERAGWQKERSDMSTKIKLLEKQSRHWGLCAMPVGYTVRGRALDAGAGICYRY